MYVESPSRTYQAKDGSTRTYRTHLLRRSFRDGGKVKKETLANLSALPDSEPFSSSDFAGLKDVDGFGELPGAPGAAAEFAQDAPGLELGVGAFTR